MAKKKKSAPAKSKTSPATLNDEKYLSSGRARSLPIYKCFINEGWDEEGMAEIFVARKHVNGHVTVGVYLVDTYCTGLKKTFYYFNTPEDDFEDLISGIPLDLEEIPYELAHNIIYGAIAYAQDYGIDPHPEFQLTQMILEEDTEDVELIELEFGRNGKPALLINPAGDPRADYYLRQLEKYAGPGNYDVVDGRLEDDFNDAYDDLEDHYAFPEDWNKGDWEEFIDETEPEELIDYIEAAAFMYDKTVAAPTQAANLLTKETEHVGMAITYEALPNSYSAEELNEIEQARHLINTIDASKENLRKLKKKLQENIVKWPENHIFLNHLTMVYRKLNDDENAWKTIQQLRSKFPDYLHGRIVYAEMLLDQGKADEVPAVFNKQYHLKGIAPERDTFHISELVAFNTVMADYYYETGDLYMANLYVKLLDQIEIPDNMPMNIILFLKINVALAKEMEPVLREAKQSEEKKRELIAQLVN
ncbi:hypothetical protein DXT99_14740 [Pontibacter diazotrophicus]|uniref:Tetratricopeptide repeat protein n=1 Tax=Pontibacter diazotrophicus TaxID=1400979 RepID=A0A3D8LAC2_9BACT|nr:hypothetical protein [Pontibacter diazotrophicus]RDV14379.1 hypothetical protein DXT99_14740 [Pontibacter diazotrophicus]